jgi:hypothetical protein
MPRVIEHEITSWHMSDKGVNQELTLMTSRDAVVSYRKRSVEVTLTLMICYVSDRLEASMKMLIVVSVVIASLFNSPAAHGQSNAIDQGMFDVEIQPAAEGGPKFRVTNLSSKPVTACVFQFSVSSERPYGQMVWDAIVQGGRDPRRGDQQPLGPGANMTMDLPFAFGEHLPDKVEIVAVVWEDGATFGDAKWLKAIIDQRASLASAYEQAISLLQKGLDENWTRDQLSSALSSAPDSLPFHSMRSTLRVNSGSRSLQKTMQYFLASFNRSLMLLRQAKPPAGTPAAPSAANS